jgi:type IV pilus assembly protein PilF
MSFGRFVLQLACCVSAVLLGACVSTNQPASGPAPGAAAAPNSTPSEPATAERRAQVRLELAGAYFSRGQMTTALEELRLALAANPNLPEAYVLRGLIYGNLGNNAEAEASFQRALQMNPRDADALHNHAWFLCQQRRFDEADARFAQVIALPQLGEMPRTLLARGVCQARAGQWADAERTLARGYELDPTNPATAYNLADVLLHRGELERARFYVRRINQVPQQITAQSLWLAARIERRIGNIDGMQDLGRQLRERFPQSPETLQFERGRFDE